VGGGTLEAALLVPTLLLLGVPVLGGRLLVPVGAALGLLLVPVGAALWLRVPALGRLLLVPVLGARLRLRVPVGAAVRRGVPLLGRRLLGAGVPVLLGGGRVPLLRAALGLGAGIPVGRLVLGGVPVGRAPLWLLAGVPVLVPLGLPLAVGLAVVPLIVRHARHSATRPDHARDVPAFGAGRFARADAGAASASARGADRRARHE